LQKLPEAERTIQFTLTRYEFAVLVYTQMDKVQMLLALKPKIEDRRDMFPKNQMLGLKKLLESLKDKKNT
jgi:hypothetical protein